MAQISEVDFSTAMQGALVQGLDELDLGQQVTFTPYARVVLPLDGYVFWQPMTPFVVNGSLHYSQRWIQAADEATGEADVIFTAESKVQQFSSTTQNKIFVAPVGATRFAISQQTGFYSQAGLWHYVGKFIYPALTSQLLDPPVKVNLAERVVSNSFPFWVDLATYTTFYLQLSNTIPIFPAYMVAENMTPPYIVVDIQDTEPLQSVPLLGVVGTHDQWVCDRLTLTFYGTQNDQALLFQDLVNQYSLETDNFGIMEEQVIYDERRVQEEIHGIAMKKTLKLVVSYQQSVAESLSFQLIKTAVPTVTINPSGV